MLLMKQLLVLLFFPLSVFCQNTIGLPDITNYTKQMYSAGLQNWDIKQDNNGLIYAANNEGLLSFDGKNWNLYPLPNKTIVRSVEIGFDNKIYVGGQDEFGYFSPSANGQLQYHALTDLIAPKDRTFGDVWDIVSYNNSIFFRTTNKIFKLTNEKFVSYMASFEWAYLGVCNGKLYAHDYKTGLLHFENDTWTTLPIKNVLPLNDPITSIVALENDSAIITTLRNGLYSLSASGILKITSGNNSLFENERIFAALGINKQWLAIATSNNGVFIIDHVGNIIQSFAKKEGLQNNNVLSILLDRQKNLWLGLDNGIDLIAYNSAIKQINPSAQDGSGYTAIIHNSQLFLGTTNGLFGVPIPQINDLSFTKANFTPIANTKGQTWGMAVINNQLLLGKHEGAFEIQNNAATSLSANAGYWNFVPLSNTFPTAQMIAGNYKSVEIFDYVNEHFVLSKKIDGFEESARFIAIDKDNNIWVSHPYHGLYKISKKEDGNYTTTIYTDKQGLPSILNNHVYKIKNEIVVATEKGIYTLKEDKNIFEASAYYKKILGDLSIRYLKEDVAGNIWFIHEKSIGVIDFTGKAPTVINLPELNNKMLSGFEFIYPLNDNNIFLGGEKGFYHINFEKYKQANANLQVQIRKVKTIDDVEEVLFGGYFRDINEKQIQDEDRLTHANKNWKTIQFQFSASVFGSFSNLQYSYRLKGFDDAWSSWSEKTEKEYTNLPAGTFHFEVKVRNNLGKESEAASYAFKILPLWYQSILARIFYFLLFLIIITILFKWQERKFNAQKIKFEEEQLKLEEEKKKLLYIHELEIKKTEGELTALRNEKLEAEISFKNAELASSAMHLVKKGELLSKSKTDLTHVMKGVDNPQAVGELKKMIKNLSEDDKMDKEWESFSKHFDTVHSQFLVSIKEKHPTITGNEMKLCAYLRMNLSTKEIAQLMNISVRGVEIGRYRLRKKLQLETSVSLFDYFINIK
jgi:DNA-binding CsgD family transcriptional regulator